MKTTNKVLIKNTTTIGLGNIIGRILGYFLLIIIARWMTKSEYGETRYIISLAQLIAIFITFGLPTASTHYIAKYKNNEKRNFYFSTIISLYILILIITEFIIIFLFWNRPIIIFATIGYSLPLIYLGILRGTMEYKKFSMTLVFRNLTKFIILFLLFYTIGINKTSTLLVYSFGGWITIIILETIKKSDFHYISDTVSKKYIKKILKYSIPVLITTFSYSLIIQCPIIFLEYFMEYEDVAIYSIAFTLSLTYGLVPSAISTVTMPKISTISERTKINQILIQSFLITIFTGLMLWIGTIFLGKWILNIIFAEKYQESFAPLLILSIGSIFLGLRNTFSALWDGIQKPIYNTYNTCGGAIAILISSFLLIPIYGVMGAAISFSMGWIISVLINSLFWIRYKLGKI